MPDKEQLQSEQTDLQSEESENQDNQSNSKSLEEIERRLKETALEAKKYRQSNSELKAKLEEIEKKKLEEQGKYKEMYEDVSQKYDGLLGSLKQETRKAAFKREAIKAGCDPEMVDLLESKADLDKIELDDRYKPDLKQVTFVVESLKSQFSKLFTKDVRPPKDGTPKAGDSIKTDVVSEARKATSQSELDAVLKKHGLS